MYHSLCIVSEEVNKASKIPVSPCKSYKLLHKGVEMDVKVAKNENIGLNPT